LTDRALTPEPGPRTRGRQPPTAEVHFVVITGLSGAGKSHAAHVFEDMGFFCVDNLPPALIPRFAELIMLAHDRFERIAVVTDIRSGEFFNAVPDALRFLDSRGIPYQILFLDASDEALLRRFKETRRKHPLAPTGSVLDGIQAERQRLEAIRERADRVIDTSEMTPQTLRDEIHAAFAPADQTAKSLAIGVVSFGYKHGLPIDADLVLDVRFLPNPHYVESLRSRPGTDDEVRRYVMRWPQAQTFRQRLEEMVSFLLPQFVAEGKSHLTVAIGCTGGRHRSVVFAEDLAAFVRAQGYEARVRHRDIERG
jgi:UPF0042 nucleotide-binding protein